MSSLLKYGFTAKVISTPSIGAAPYQPNPFHFPQREFGRPPHVTKRSFQPSWFAKWTWLHYNEEEDVAYCFYCIKAYQQNKLHGVSNMESTYISTGYRNWKEATTRFPMHESSRCHKDAMLTMVTLPATTRDIGETLSQQHRYEKQNNRQCFLKILSNIKFLSRQGLPFRGNGDESDSNFLQLIKLREIDYPKLSNWMAKKTNTYTSPEIQNELLKLFSCEILRHIASSLHSSPFLTVMIDETTDVSNHEQVVVCVRWVNADFDIQEDFIGLSQVDQIDAGTLVGVIKDIFLRMNISLHKLRGQCYDGAATMAGLRSGVAKQIQDVEPRAVYTHCYGHSLNLACADTIKTCKLLKDALDTTHEITKLIKKSPRRNAIFDRIRGEMASDAPGIRVLCPTRWTVRAEALQSILENYEVLMELWEESVEVINDTEMKARILGVRSAMQTFDFFYGATLAYMILRHTDNLSCALQKGDISASEGQDTTAMTVKTLQSLRMDDKFHLFWQKCVLGANRMQVNEPTLPRRRKVPRRFEEGREDSYSYPLTPEDHYRHIYFEAIDLIVNCITERFNQPGFLIYQHVESLLLKAANCKEYQSELKFVLEFYGSDLDGSSLATQLEIFSTACKSSSQDVYKLSDIVKFFKTLTPSQIELMSQVCKAFRLLLVMPATNAASERSFSTLRRVKSYLRSTMTQQRLNHLMVLHIHKERTDKIDIVSVANEFVAQREHRSSIFGKFTEADLI